MDLDLAALIVRLALGPMLVAHGLNKVLGPGGLVGTAGWFASLGFRLPHLQARLAAATEIVAGILLTAGAATPLACAAYVGLMAVATVTDHRGKGYFVFKGGVEYTVLVAMVAVALASLGPGSWSLDDLVGVDAAGPRWAMGSAALGLGAAAALVAAFRRVPAGSS